MTVAYRISVPEPEAHLVRVTLEIDDAAELGDAVELQMAAWCPGSYLIRDYARHVRDLEAADESGNILAATKTSKHTWRIERRSAERVVVRYQVYGHDLSVRTNHIDGTHAFLHGPATYLWLPARRDAEASVSIVVPTDRSWELSTGLPKVDGGFAARDVDELLDCPIHMGRVDVRSFEAAGKPAQIVVWGEADAGAKFGLDDLREDLRKIIDAHAERFEGVPYDDYTFILMLSPGAYGGLEHRNSSANLSTPFSLSARSSYCDLLELLSHELFHVWNGKRMCPAAFEPLDYSGENYTRCLWVVEGLTSYYDRRTLRTTGAMTVKRYLEKLADEWGRLRAMPGRGRHSLEESSFDAWVKLYKPDESNINTTVSYYLKGGLVATVLDLLIRRKTNAERSLDDVLRHMWSQHGIRAGYPENVQPLFEAATDLELSEVFDDAIRGRKDPDLAGELSHLGLVLSETWDRRAKGEGQEIPPWLGVMLSSHSTRIGAVLDGSPAAAAGLSPGDEVVAVDGYRVRSESDIRKRLRKRSSGSRADIAVFRRDRLVQATAALEPSPPNRVEISVVDDITADQRAAAQAWLGAALPESGVIAGATSSRWT